MSFPSCDDKRGARERWNQKYRDAAGTEIWTVPDDFLLMAFAEYIQPTFPQGGSALDFAGGAGRNAIWLAKQGWEVTLIDISETGVEQAREAAGPLASHIQFVVDDLTEYKASQTQYDVVMGFFFLERKIFTEIVKAVRPGGLLVYKNAHVGTGESGGWTEESRAFAGSGGASGTGRGDADIALQRGSREEGDGGVGGEGKTQNGSEAGFRCREGQLATSTGSHLNLDSCRKHARVAELADAPDLGSGG